MGNQSGKMDEPVTVRMTGEERKKLRQDSERLRLPEGEIMRRGYRLYVARAASRERSAGKKPPTE